MMARHEHRIEWQPGAAIHLIPLDEDWLAMLDQIEEPLLLTLAAWAQDDDVRLPEVFAGDGARECWWRIRRAIKAAFADAGRHRLLASDGTYELAPLAPVEIAEADLKVLVKVAYECSRALAGLSGGDLAEALDEIASNRSPAGYGKSNESPTEALVKVVNTLTLLPDGDARLLIDVIGRGVGADVVLTAEETDAYRRYVRRFVARMGGGGLELYSYGVDR